MINFNISLNVDEMEKAGMDIARRVLYRSMRKMQELAQDFAPGDTGSLAGSIKINPKVPGADEYTLTAWANYSLFVEYGTKPHYVSPKVLKGWAKRVLGDEDLAYPVAAKIAREGTPAQPFMRPAFDEVATIWVKAFWAQELAKEIKPGEL